MSSNEENGLIWDQYEVIIKLIQDESFPMNIEPQQEMKGAILFQQWEQPPIQCTEPDTTGYFEFYIVHLSPESEYCFS